ncbi:MAG: TIGR03905 family TSCPD domain-containing protein [Bacteroidaceae bacterium]|nr:TIGR03905 family TSCPD domain-containing protein [Bacteroidaceae bacterium]
MAHYSYIPEGVCSKCIDFDIEDGKLHNIRFTNGCDGNLKAISKLLEGADAQWAVNRLRGNTCGNKNTSCADQFAKAVGQALAQ